MANFTNGTTYYIRARHRSSSLIGNWSPGSSIRYVLQVPTCWISVSPSSITSGNSATLSWGSSYATSASISGIGAVAVSGSRSVSPGVGTTSYTLSVSGPGGSNSSSCSLSVTKPQITPGSTGGTVPSGGNNGVNASGPIFANRWSFSITSVGAYQNYSTSGSNSNVSIRFIFKEVSSPSATSWYTVEVSVYNSDGSFSSIAPTAWFSGGGGVTASSWSLSWS